MDQVTFVLNELVSCLSSTPPLELKGMGLLREQPRLITGFASLPRIEIVEAVTEIVAYSGRCAAAARNLANLTPVPLMNAIVWEFGI